MRTQPTLILIHGSWHDGSAWAHVRWQLAAAGVRSHVPTLRGHEPAANRRLITHDDYVASVLEVLAAETDPVVLVGHSFGGSVISRVAALVPERCRGLIYCSAFVPRDGERVADSLPEDMLAFLNQSADATPDRSITLPYTCSNTRSRTPPTTSAPSFTIGRSSSMSSTSPPPTSTARTTTRCRPEPSIPGSRAGSRRRRSSRSTPTTRRTSPHPAASPRRCLTRPRRSGRGNSQMSRSDNKPEVHSRARARHRTRQPPMSDARTPIDANPPQQRFWKSLDGTPGEVLWEADACDLETDLKRFDAAFGRRLPVVDLGCGDGRQTRFLARRFPSVIGVDYAAAAIERATAAANPANVSYRVLDARDLEAATALHGEIGDANVYIRGVLHRHPPEVRRLVVQTTARLLGRAGALFVKELSSGAPSYFRSIIDRYGPPPGLTRVMRLSGPPGHMSESDLLGLFPPERFDVIRTGASRIDTVNTLPTGRRIAIPAIYALVRPRPGTRQAT